MFKGPPMTFAYSRQRSASQIPGKLFILMDPAPLEFDRKGAEKRRGPLR